MKITYNRLKKLGACQEQLLEFKNLFGQSVVVTEALCIQHAATFSWDWAARKLLSTQAYTDYQIMRDRAGAEYKRIEAKAFAEWRKLGWTPMTASDAAWAVYKSVSGDALINFKCTKAIAFATLLLRS